MKKKTFLLVALVLVLTLINGISSHANASTVEVFTDETAFVGSTGAVTIPFPTDASAALGSQPFGFNDHSCTDNETGIDLGSVTVTAPAANNWLCFLGSGWNAGSGNIDPNPASPTIVANGEDDYHVVAFDEPVSAVGFELLTNSSASESIKLNFVGGDSEIIEDSVLDTAANQFEFVGFQTTELIISVEIDTTGGASQNEGISGIWVLSGEGPVTSNVEAVPNPVSIKASVNLTASVDDTETGGSAISSAEYSLESGEWIEMDASDQVFDDVNENVTVDFTAPDVPGIYELCVRGTDAMGQTGEPACIMLVVYDPDGGFVTGGGWIESPAGAYLLSGPVSISGDTASINYLGYTGFMYRNLDVVCDPNNTPVTFSGTLDVTSLQDNGADLFGVVDKKSVDEGELGYQAGAYLYVGRRGDDLIVGPSDGNAGGGELVQTFTTFVDYFADGDPTPLSVAAEIFAGTVEVNIAGNDYIDDYGTVVSTSEWTEFQYGAYIGIDSWPSSNSVVYDLTFDGCSVAPSGKANFGFVSKYKKGANVPTGNTQFVFKAGNLNFHSNVQEWLVVTGNNTAKFKGVGTVNGEVDENGNPFKFQLWAGDKSGDNGEDTFRIKIWWEEGGVEYVVYDNGMDQAIGGGNIVVHSK